MAAHPLPTLTTEKIKLSFWAGLRVSYQSLQLVCDTAGYLHNIAAVTAHAPIMCFVTPSTEPNIAALF